MTNADCWAGVVVARTRHDSATAADLDAQQGREREAAIDLRPVPGVGAEIVLSADGELRDTRLYRAHEQAEPSGAIGPRAAFEGKGWA